MDWAIPVPSDTENNGGWVRADPSTAAFLGTDRCHELVQALHLQGPTTPNRQAWEESVRALHDQLLTHYAVVAQSREATGPPTPRMALFLRQVQHDLIMVPNERCLVWDSDFQKATMHLAFDVRALAGTVDSIQIDYVPGTEYTRSEVKVKGPHASPAKGLSRIVKRKPVLPLQRYPSPSASTSMPSLHQAVKIQTLLRSPLRSAQRPVLPQIVVVVVPPDEVPEDRESRTTPQMSPRRRDANTTHVILITPIKYSSTDGSLYSDDGITGFTVPFSDSLPLYSIEEQSVAPPPSPAPEEEEEMPPPLSVPLLVPSIRTKEAQQELMLPRPIVRRAPSRQRAGGEGFEELRLTDTANLPNPPHRAFLPSFPVLGARHGSPSPASQWASQLRRPHTRGVTPTSQQICVGNPDPPPHVPGSVTTGKAAFIHIRHRDGVVGGATVKSSRRGRDVCVTRRSHITQKALDVQEACMRQMHGKAHERLHNM